MKKYNIKVNGNSYEVEVEEIGGSVQTVSEPVAQQAQVTAPAPKATPVAGGTDVKAPMPGTILKITKNVGDSVKKGETVAVLEAMKMENEIAAPVDGTIASVAAAVGASINTGATIVVIK